MSLLTARTHGVFVIQSEVGEAWYFQRLVLNGRAPIAIREIGGFSVTDWVHAQVRQRQRLFLIDFPETTSVATKLFGQSGIETAINAQSEIGIWYKSILDHCNAGLLHRDVGARATVSLNEAIYYQRPKALNSFLDTWGKSPLNTTLPVPDRRYSAADITL
jgi:hypothetical protein